MNIVATTPVAGPYVLARYGNFASIFPQHALTLVEFSRLSDDYDWRPSEVRVPFNRVVLSDRPLSRLPRRLRRQIICNALDKLRPDVLVVCGYGPIGMGAALYWARSQAPTVPVVLLSDSAEEDERRVWWKEYIKTRIVRQCGSALVAGRRHREYMRSLGMSSSQIFEGYDVVDNDYFANATSAARNGGRQSCLFPRPFFLASSRFLEKKNLIRLLEAFAQYRHRAGPLAWDLVLLGDGGRRRDIESAVEVLELYGSVHLPGFRQYEELPFFYAWAGCFVHASTTEQWGLVVNEAMASGLPVLVSDRCGCAEDLVEAGRNGFKFDPYDVEALAALMLKVAANDVDRAAMGKASCQIISRWDLPFFSVNLNRAIERAAGLAQPTAAVIDRALLRALSKR